MQLWFSLHSSTAPGRIRGQNDQQLSEIDMWNFSRNVNESSMAWAMYNNIIKRLRQRIHRFNFLSVWNLEAIEHRTPSLQFLIMLLAMDTKNMLRLFFPSFIPLLLIVSLVLSGIKMNDSVCSDTYNIWQHSFTHSKLMLMLRWMLSRFSSFGITEKTAVGTKRQ